MSYYDNVKDNVKDESSGGDEGPSFDTLKEAAQDEGDEEEKANDTPIEVLEEGGLSQRKGDESSSSRNPESDGSGGRKERGADKASKDRSTEEVKDNRSRDQNPVSGERVSADIEEKLDRIIEQNDRMIEILESFRS